MPYLHEGPNLYLTNDGAVVEEGDPNAAFLLVANGAQLDDETAKQHGLPKKAKAEHAETKLKPGAKEDKSA